MAGLKGGAPTAIDWERLAQESMTLVSHIDTQGVPTIQKNIAQLDAASRKLVMITLLNENGYLQTYFFL